MPGSERPLKSLQHWLQESIVGPTPENLVEEIAASSRQSAAERLEVYQHAYFARLIECLGEEFEGVQEAVGEAAFQQLGIEYLVRHPSTSYTLADLGKNFPKFLADTRPAREANQPDWGDFLIDLATLERIYAEVFDGPGSERRENSLVIDPERILLPTTRLVLCPSVRLLEVRFPVHRYLSALRRGENPAVPEVLPTRLVISRREYVVRREEIDEVQHKLLKRLLEDGDLLAALELASNGTSPGELESRIGEWFERWTRLGILVGIEYPEG